MKKIFNKDGFNWWIGVVEDRKDPEYLGRVRVRVFGYHTDSKELLPTRDLPWAVPIQPITSAAQSGIGTTPLGPLEGTWVIGFFLDGEDMQQPAIFGTISTKAAQKTFETITERPNTVNSIDGILKDKNNNPVVDQNGTPVRTAVPSVDGWELGKTSARYESGGKGPGVVNDYNGAASGDLGGASYGTYQLASYLPAIMKNGRSRPSPKNSPVQQFIKNSKFREQFKGLEPATSEFDAKWREIAGTNPEEFRLDQHDYIQRKYYEVMIANLQRNGLDMTKFGPAVQDLVWSTAVQFGPARTSLFTIPLKNKTELTDRDIVLLVSQYKINMVDELFQSSSASIRAGVRTRFENEKTDLLGLIKA